MRLTIRVDDEVLKQARVRALREGTTVSAVVQDYLESYAEGSSRCGAAIHRFFALARITGAGRGDAIWTRDELYER